MAIGTTETLLSLDRYAQIMGLPAAHFNNLNDNTATHAGRSYWKRITHDDLSAAIAQAEQILAERMGFNVAPVYEAETVQMPRTHRHDWWNLRVRLPHAYVQQLGSASWQVIAADAAVVLSEAEGTVTVDTAELDAALLNAEEHVLFYRTADGAPAEHHACWRIRPVDGHIETDPAQLVYTAPRAQFVKPDVLTQEQPATFTDDANFVAAVDVYALVHDPVLPLSLIWPGDTPDGNAMQGGAGRIVDRKHGRIQVRPATVDATTEQHVAAAPLYASKPERFEVDYQAGYPLQEGRINSQLEQAIVRLSNVILPETGHRLNDMALQKWHADRALDETTGLPYGMAFAETVAAPLRVV